MINFLAAMIAQEQATGVQRKSLTFRPETRLRKLTWKSLIFPVLIPSAIIYRELGGKFDSERYIQHHIVRYVAKT